MKTLTWAFLSLSPLLASSGCSEKNSVTPVGQTCDNERVLEIYQNREAKVIKTELNRYCLTVDPDDVAGSSYRLPNVLVPVSESDIPAQYRVEGLHVLLSGRKKSCYGLTSLPNVYALFGYKLEVDTIKKSDKGD
jgi:hypothetical protein